MTATPSLKRTQSVSSSAASGKAATSSGSYGYYHADGTLLLEPNYAFAGEFHDGLALVSLSGECFFHGSILSCVRKAVLLCPNFTRCRRILQAVPVIRNGIVTEKGGTLRFFSIFWGKMPVGAATFG